MRESLSHLPENKQLEIRRIAEIIREVVDPEKIILFGSYAKGEQVEDRYVENGIVYEYRSDYDILIVTKGNTEKEFLLLDRIVNKSRHLTPVAINPIIHEIDYVNEGLRIGQYFFTDIVKEGVLLIDKDGKSFEEPKVLSREEQRMISTRYFDMWFEKGTNQLLGAEFYESKKLFKESVFSLHQAAEAFYNTILLVITGYKPKTHNLDKLRQYAKPYSKELMQVFPDPTNDVIEFHLFDLLKRGYIDARYKDDYKITEEEIKILIGKVNRMKMVVEQVSQDHLNSL